MNAATGVEPRWGILFTDGDTCWIGTRTEAEDRMASLEKLATIGAVAASHIAGMALVEETTPTPPPEGLAEKLLAVLTGHVLDFERYGDGWQEPFEEHSHCACTPTGRGYESWQQYDPAHSGYDEFRVDSETQHRKHQAALLAAVATAHSNTKETI